MKPQVTESATDQVLARLFQTSDSAVRSCLAAIAQSSPSFAFDRVTVEHQVRHRGACGTADLVLRILLQNEIQALILIENKIDSGFTPDQPARYALSREAHISGRSAPLVAAVLCASSAYIAGSRLKDAFDGTLTYETLLPLLNGADRATLELAIERACSPYEPFPVEAVMGFFDGYTAIAAEAFPELSIKTNPNVAPHSIWRCERTVVAIPRR